MDSPTDLQAHDDLPPNSPNLTLFPASEPAQRQSEPAENVPRRLSTGNSQQRARSVPLPGSVNGQSNASDQVQVTHKQDDLNHPPTSEDPVGPKPTTTLQKSLVANVLRRSAGLSKIGS